MSTCHGPLAAWERVQWCTKGETLNTKTYLKPCIVTKISLTPVQLRRTISKQDREMSPTKRRCEGGKQKGQYQQGYTPARLCGGHGAPAQWQAGGKAAHVQADQIRAAGAVVTAAHYVQPVSQKRSRMACVHQQLHLSITRSCKLCKGAILIHYVQPVSQQCSCMAWTHRKATRPPFSHLSIAGGVSWTK